MNGLDLQSLVIGAVIEIFIWAFTSLFLESEIAKVITLLISAIILIIIFLKNKTVIKPKRYNQEMKKSKMTALILCIFLGYLGVHRFYLGRWKTGLLWLCTMGLKGYGWVIDIFLIIFGKLKDKDDLPLQ